MRTLHRLSAAALVAAMMGILACGASSESSEEAVLASDQATTTRQTGCSDGTREGFVDATRYPSIAGCSGAWRIPGILGFNPGEAPACPGLRTFDTRTPACGREPGPFGTNSAGVDCNVADLCAEGWHVCNSAAEVAALSHTGCDGAVPSNSPSLFFATRQSSNGCGVCATGDRTGGTCDSESCTSGCAQTAAISNDVFGCGNLGATTDPRFCGPLDVFSNDLCSSLTKPGANRTLPWRCDAPGPADTPDTGLCEAYTLLKGNNNGGGVLCCVDD